MLSHTPSYNEWHHDDDTHEDQYKAELLSCYKGLIHDRVDHERCDRVTRRFGPYSLVSY